MTKILLVEDDKSLREIYGVRLLAEGYDIVSAGDGEEALAMAIKERPNLIISDVMMPKISGFDMLDILRSTTETRGIKVIMMTALSSEDQRKRGESLGADKYLVKSQVGIEDVVKTVHDVLGDGHLTPEQRTANKSEPRAPENTQPQQEVRQQPAAFTAPNQQPATHRVTPNTAATRSQPQQIPRPQESIIQSAPQPAPAPSPTRQPENVMPRPTAPFSTNRPSNLGDRVIKPLNNPNTQEVDEREFSEQMNNILSGTAPEELNRSNVIQPQAQPTAQPQRPNLTPVSDITSRPPQPIGNTQTQQMPVRQPGISPHQQTPQQFNSRTQPIVPQNPQQARPTEPIQPTPQPQQPSGPFFGAR